MVSHPNTVKPGTVQFQRPNSCHCWTLINFWWVSPPSHGSKCSSPHVSDLKAPKNSSVPSQLPGKPRLLSTFSTPQELVISQFIQAANVRVHLAANVKSRSIPQKLAAQESSVHESHSLHFPLTAQSSQNNSLHWSCVSSAQLLLTGCSEGLWMSSQRQRLALTGRRQGRKYLPAPTPRLFHTLFLWMTAWYNCHIDSPSFTMGFSSLKMQ